MFLQCLPTLVAVVNLLSFHLQEKRAEMAKELAKCVRYKEFSLYQGSLPYISLLLGPGKSTVITRTSLFIDSLNRRSNVVPKGGLTCLKYTMIIIIPKVQADVT